MNDEASIMVWMYFSFDIARKMVLLLCLDVPLKNNFFFISSYVKLVLSWLSGFLEEAICYIVNSCPGIINLAHMSECFILRTSSGP